MLPGTPEARASRRQVSRSRSDGSRPAPPNRLGKAFICVGLCTILQTWLHVQIAFPARIRQSIKAAWEAGEDLDRKLGMYLKQKQVLSKQSASATKLWLISVSCLLVVVMVLKLQHWKRRKHVNHVKPLITPAPLLSQPEPIEPQFMP